MASVSIVKIKIRRGTNAERKLITLDNGELGYVTDLDYKRLYVGDGVLRGGHPIGMRLFFPAQAQITSTYANAELGDLVFDTATTAMYVVSSTNTGIPALGSVNQQFSKIDGRALPTANPGQGLLWRDAANGNVVKVGI